MASILFMDHWKTELQNVYSSLHCINKKPPLKTISFKGLGLVEFSYLLFKPLGQPAVKDGGKDVGSITNDRLHAFELQPTEIEVYDQVIKKGFFIKTFVIFGGENDAATTSFLQSAVNLRRLKITKTRNFWVTSYIDVYWRF